MIPSVSGFLNQDFEIEEQTSQTYKMNFGKQNIRGTTDKFQAIEQAIYKILNTERYRYIVYSWNYGVEFFDLLGQPISYVLPEIKRRITEALTHDDRIQAVDNFKFEVNKNVVYVTFIAHTIYGDIESEKAVNF